MMCVVRRVLCGVFGVCCLLCVACCRACCSSGVGCHLVFGVFVRCLQFVVRCVLCVGRRLLVAVCCLLYVAGRVPLVVRCALSCSLVALCCLLRVAWRLLFAVYCGVFVV